MKRAALFDVDGTLADTNHLHVVCWWEALRQAGHDIAMHDIHRAIGLPGEDLLAHVLGEDRDTTEDDTLSAAHSTLYGTYFDRLPPLGSAADLLRELNRRGWRVVLVTSAKDAELDALRRAVDADDAITATASSDDVSEGKPAPDPVHHALGLADAPAQGAVLVGDTVWDMQAGLRPCSGSANECQRRSPWVWSIDSMPPGSASIRHLWVSRRGGGRPPA
ncbi:HAD family hydrolase [Streptomyces sp. NBC_01214]|uniref:HAD family hydrolase n=1 Tax=Streptomyces sp. NBC_01214 TaxID=2903777 RepID=UPI0022548D5C|nr:HAD family hydrolase [Streptomyces sp. NBC_01214]MCX4804569.1 HAD family hydrolase [Streptomyces sp. NBC_01214]